MIVERKGYCLVHRLSGEIAKGVWFSKNLGDAMWSWESLSQIEEVFTSAYTQADNPEEMALFTRHESEGRLHCEVVAYFSPASVAIAKEFDAVPCARPSPHGLALLVGSENFWLELFPEREG